MDRPHLERSRSQTSSSDPTPTRSRSATVPGLGDQQAQSPGGESLGGGYFSNETGPLVTQKGKKARFSDG